MGTCLAALFSFWWVEWQPDMCPWSEESANTWTFIIFLGVCWWLLCYAKTRFFELHCRWTHISQQGQFCWLDMVRVKITLGVALEVIHLSGILMSHLITDLWWSQKLGGSFLDFLVTVLHTFLGIFSEAGEKYALRLADFVHKRLKNERTASVRSSYLS